MTKRRKITEWWDDYKPADGSIIEAQLNTRSWDELDELCNAIHEQEPSLRAHYDLVCIYDYQRLLSKDDWDRIKAQYITRAKALAWTDGLPNDLPPLREVKVWELYLTKYRLMDMCVMINELVDEFNDDHLKAMWELYTGPMFEYLNIEFLTESIISKIANYLEAGE